jgi:hypothetical protein
MRSAAWRCGQYAQLIPHSVFIALIADARGNGTILDQGDPWHRSVRLRQSVACRRPRLTADFLPDAEES